MRPLLPLALLLAACSGRDPRPPDGPFCKEAFEEAGQALTAVSEGRIHLAGCSTIVGESVLISVAGPQEDPRDAVDPAEVARLERKLGVDLYLVRYSEQKDRYFASANELGPEPERVLWNPLAGVVEVVVRADQRAALVGRDDLRLRQLSELVRAEVRVYTVDDWGAAQDEARAALLAVQGVDEARFQALFAGGYRDAATLGAADPVAIAALLGLSEADARALVLAAAERAGG